MTPGSSSLAAGVAALALAFAACGGSSSSASSPTAPTSPTSPSSIPGGVCSVIGGTARITTSIVNGTTCTADASPIAKLNLADASGQPIASCSGTIIAPRAVLTAAHCLNGDTASVQVWFGTGPQIQAASFHFYPTYQESDSSSLDVGVVLFDQDLPRTPVPLLLSRDPTVGELAVIAGWGNDQTGSSAILPRAGTTTIASVGSAVIQTEYSSNMSAVCSGDSGGPLLVSEGGVWAIAGITSAVSVGGACTMGTNYFAKVRNADISSFIRGLVPDAVQR